MALKRLPRNSRYMEIRLNDHMEISKLNKIKNSIEGVLINGGVYLFSHTFFSGQTTGHRSSLEKEMIPKAMEIGKRIYGFVCEEYFIDIGIPKDYFRAINCLTEFNQ